MTCLDIGGTPSIGRTAGNIEDAGGFNQRNTDIKIDEEDKGKYIPGTGSYATGIPVGDSSQWRR